MLLVPAAATVGMLLLALAAAEAMELPPTTVATVAAMGGAGWVAAAVGAAKRAVWEDWAGLLSQTSLLSLPK